MYNKQDNVHTNTESVQCISIVYSIKIKVFYFKLYSSNVIVMYSIIMTKQLTLSIRLVTSALL